MLQSFTSHHVACPAALYNRLWVRETSHAPGRLCWYGDRAHAPARDDEGHQPLVHGRAGTRALRRTLRVGRTLPRPPPTPPGRRDTMADHPRTTTGGTATGVTATAFEQLKGQVRGDLL